MNPDHRVLQAIRSEYPGRLPHGLLRLLAREFGLSKSRVWRIMRGEQ